MAELRDANLSPWYVLMTLYGEQPMDHVDISLAQANRAVWNAWACQDMSDDEARRYAKLVHDESDTDYEELVSATFIETRDWARISDGVQELYPKEMASRHEKLISEKIVYRGFPTLQMEVDLRGLKFWENVVFDHFIFPKSILFDGSELSAPSYFQHTLFLEKTSFGSTTFSELASFNDSKFIDEVHFQSVSFRKDAKFFRTIFNKSTSFRGGVFCGDAYFRSSKFLCNAQFQGSTFEARAFFADTEFGKITKEHGDFLNFKMSQFRGAVDFKRASFQSEVPSFDGATFDRVVLLSTNEKDWPTSASSKEAAKNNYGILRGFVSDQGFPEDEHFFFRREMAFAAQIGGWWQRLPYRAFGLLSNYGESIARPSLALLALWVVPALILLCHFAWVGVMEGFVWSGLDAWGLSFANIFTVFGFHRLYFDADQIRQLHWTLQVMGAAQTVFALPLLFFLGLALRKRFRLR